jgi:hypothetical protein
MDTEISREDLQRHGIYFQPNVYQAKYADIPATSPNLPDHVDAVREGLLFMEKILPDDCESILRKELAEHENMNIGPDWCLHPPQSAFIHVKHHERVLHQSTSLKNLEECENISERAREMLEDSEDEWTFFWRSKMFKTFNDEAREQSGLR